MLLNPPHPWSRGHLRRFQRVTVKTRTPSGPSPCKPQPWNRITISQCLTPFSEVRHGLSKESIRLAAQRQILVQRHENHLNTMRSPQKPSPYTTKDVLWQILSRGKAWRLGDVNVYHPGLHGECTRPAAAMSKYPEKIWPLPSKKFCIA